ncbi:MAG: WG repeat-containing protein, partial [Oscillospiraceae bacterium]|nr:WG repeat-containing protein [Oscillospiraceae bacterium]
MAVIRLGDTETQLGKWGFINQSGQLVVPTIYDSAMPFSEGLACVSQGSKGGYIDKSGNVVIPLVYDSADSFYGGVAVVGTGTYPNHKEGIIDKTGRLIVPIEYDYIYNYEGSDLMSAIKGEQLYFLDRTGKVAATYPLLDDSIEGDTGHGFFSEGLAANYTADYKTEYIDTTGKVVAQYDFGRALEDGMAYVEKDGKPGFMDKTGKLAFTLQIPAGYELIVSGYGPGFYHGLSVVQINKEGKEGENAACGLIDKQGNQILPYEYQSIFVYGAYGTVSDGTRWGIFQNPAYQSPSHLLIHMQLETRAPGYCLV